MPSPPQLSPSQNSGGGVAQPGLVPNRLATPNCSRHRQMCTRASPIHSVSEQGGSSPAGSFRGSSAVGLPGSQLATGSFHPPAEFEPVAFNQQPQLPRGPRNAPGAPDKHLAPTQLAPSPSRGLPRSFSSRRPEGALSLPRLNPSIHRQIASPGQTRGVLPCRSADPSRG